MNGAVSGRYISRNDFDVVDVGFVASFGDREGVALERRENRPIGHVRKCEVLASDDMKGEDLSQKARVGENCVQCRCGNVLKRIIGWCEDSEWARSTKSLDQPSLDEQTSQSGECACGECFSHDVAQW